MAFIVEEKNEVATFIIAIQVLLMRSKQYIYIYISSLWKKTTYIINELQDKNIYLHYGRRRHNVEFVVQEKMKV